MRPTSKSLLTKRKRVVCDEAFLRMSRTLILDDVIDRMACRARRGHGRAEPLLHADVRTNVSMSTAADHQRSTVADEAKDAGKERLQIRAQDLLVFVEDDPGDAFKATRPC